jgi:hypothetical protein
MRTVFGILLGIFAGAMLCGFGPRVAIDQAYCQERAEQGNLEVFAVCWPPTRRRAAANRASANAASRASSWAL